MKSTFGSKMKLGWLVATSLAVVLATVFLLWANLVAAQDADSLWSEPVNLSLSAGASEPVAVADSSGRAHVVWQDAALNFMHATLTGDVWSTAQPVELPIGTRRYYPDLLDNQETPLHTPTLWSDQADRIHAVWIDEDGQMFHSSVPSDSFDRFDAWTSRQALASSALYAAAIADSGGRLHLAYIRPAETSEAPTGLYYRQSVDGGNNWSSPILLYQSPYFRSLDREMANVQLAASSDNEVFVAWDNPFQERVFVARSGDTGQSWEAPVEVDQRYEADGPGAIGPSHIQVATAGDGVHLVWRAGHDGLECAQYHQMSVDGGQSWQAAQQIMERTLECPETNLVVSAGDDGLVLLSTAEGGGYVSAWNGLRWGQPQAQPQLSTFLNPLNFRQVELGCQQAVSLAPSDEGAAETLLFLGCSAGPVQDVWVQTAELDRLIEEISPLATPVWQQAEPVGEANGAESLQLLSDADGWLHALWSQPLSEDNPLVSIHYSRWDGTGWSQPRSILTSPEGGPALDPDVALSADGRIVVAWSDGQPGTIYFSQADLARAGNAAEWSSPAMLPMPLAAGSAPSITLDRDGIIFVAYALPLNEERGIYLTQSGDGGESWLGPAKVFDGAAAGWTMVDDPELATSEGGNLHLLWSQYSSPPEATPLALYYSRSPDDGQSWIEASEVTEAPVIWSDLIATGNLALHRFWLLDSGELWHESSSDNGALWAQPFRVSGTTGALAIADSAIDGAGRPWLLRATDPDAASGGAGQTNDLQNWVFTEGRWSTEEDLGLAGQAVSDFSAAVTAGGSMSVVFIGPENGADRAEEGQAIYFSSRSLDLPAIAPTPLPTLTPTPRPEATATPTPAPLPTATAFFPTQAGEEGGLPLPIDSSNPLTGPLLGIIPAAAVVLVAFFIGVRFLRGDRR